MRGLCAYCHSSNVEVTIDPETANTVCMKCRLK